MRIAYVCKRQYMRKDVIIDRYARLYEQPRQLALRGHDVLGLCLSYRPTSERDELHEAAPGRLRWLGFAPQGMAGILAYPRRAEAALRAFAPDIVVAASDCPHVVLGEWLARRLGVPLAVDLYDDFETFGLAKIPGLRLLYRRALRRAAVVSCVSEWLARRVREDCRADGEVIALPSTIDRAVFRPMDRTACRANLGLPADARLIGTAGGLHRDKGIVPLYEAFASLSQQDPDVHLVLAGGIGPDCPPPAGPNVHYLGELPHARTAELFNALDVGVVYLRDTPYGRASFPQKIYEMAACGLPLAVARVGAMDDMLGHAPFSLYQPDDAVSLASCVAAQLADPRHANIEIRDWSSLADDMERAYRGAMQI
ncbi:MAG: glycosyltransferase family 4 protein [Candidatus Methylumidiphilus sp.]